MGILDKFKKWLDENEGEFKDSSDKAAQFLEELGSEIGYAGSKVARSAEEALKKFDEELSKKKSGEQSGKSPYESEPRSSGDDKFFEEEDGSQPDDETVPEDESIKEAEEEVTHVEKLMDRIDELIAELKKEEEKAEREPDPRDHKSAVEQDWGGLDDDFIKKATQFADRELSKGESSGSNKKKGKVKGFEDRDDDGDEIVDDAEIDDSE